jgi:hypothetical protein
MHAKACIISVEAITITITLLLPTFAVISDVMEIPR